mmetsp:Transcript_15476/g.38339  ORF Transcript_15476/g.38339 Transcript_15476/m.38339 type:complete len:508 (-) Transcript_15476:401-1924(-)|eukprot:CAMPEP_0178988542 /NCGR_PEP_ID=MMETSP0795-20121207/3865_1 /TAXON_ID=88552 /ORGANISM="Amoebophrya sp., Strain Ameob2" /LENGTH=507 /DNA_ID=CAMNT_0020679821 /DNA_START=1852 /DNA_END=3375 /DNA_ORIENTATION=+
MGNEFSAFRTSDGIVEAVLQFNDIRDVSPQQLNHLSKQPDTAFVSVDGSVESVLKRGAETGLRLRLTAKSVISIRVVSVTGAVVGVCYVPIGNVQEKGLGLVLYHIWLLLEPIPVVDAEDLGRRFDESLYNIGHKNTGAPVRPKMCITLAVAEEYSQMKGGIYNPIMEQDALQIPDYKRQETYAGRYFSVLTSHLQHLQLCQAYYLSLQQERALSSDHGEHAIGNGAGPTSESNRPSGNFGAAPAAGLRGNEVDLFTGTAVGSSATLAQQHSAAEGALAGAGASLEEKRQLELFYRGQIASMEKEMMKLREVVEELSSRNEKLTVESSDAQARLSIEIEQLKRLSRVSISSSGAGAGMDTPSQSGAGSSLAAGVGGETGAPAGSSQAASSSEIARLQQETRNITKQANERIDKANDTIRLLRSQAKGLQEKVKLQEELLKKQEGLIEENVKLQKEIDAEKKQKLELMTIVQSLYSEALNPVSTEGPVGEGQNMLPTHAEMEKSLTTS